MLENAHIDLLDFGVLGSSPDQLLRGKQEDAITDWSPNKESYNDFLVQEILYIYIYCGEYRMYTTFVEDELRSCKT